jgi:hypothetical protein
MTEPAAEAPRPTRAELRRAAEAAATGKPAPAAPPAPSPAVTPAQAAAATSRTEQRRIAEEQAKRARTSRALWKAWWLYPLVALIGVAIWFGVQSAGKTPPDQPTVVTTVPAGP